MNKFRQPASKGGKNGTHKLLEGFQTVGKAFVDVQLPSAVETSKSKSKVMNSSTGKVRKLCGALLLNDGRTHFTRNS